MTKKATLAGVCKEFIYSHNTPVTLTQLHQACIAAGLEVSEAQVYAGVQSMASTGKCGRGKEKRTWCKLEDATPKEVKETGTGGGRKRQVVISGKYPVTQVLQQLEERLGEPISRDPNTRAYCVVLLGEWNAAFILDKAEQVLEAPPKSWFKSNQGKEIVVGFYS